MLGKLARRRPRLCDERNTRHRKRCRNLLPFAAGDTPNLIRPDHSTAKSACRCLMPAPQAVMLAKVTAAVRCQSQGGSKGQVCGARRVRRWWRLPCGIFREAAECRFALETFFAHHHHDRIMQVDSSENWRCNAGSHSKETRNATQICSRLRYPECVRDFYK